LEQTRHVGVAKSEHPRLTNGEIIFEEFQPMWSQSTNVTDTQTTCGRNTALCTKVHRAVKTEDIKKAIVLDTRGNTTDVTIVCSAVTTNNVARFTQPRATVIRIIKLWAIKYSISDSHCAEQSVCILRLRTCDCGVCTYSI